MASKRRLKAYNQLYLLPFSEPTFRTMQQLQNHLLIALLGFSLSASAQMTFEYGGQTREYYLDSPAEFDSGAALVFVLHGYGGTAWSTRNYSGWGAVAESEGIMVCYRKDHWTIKVHRTGTPTSASARPMTTDS